MPYFVPGSSELPLAPLPQPTPAIVVDKLAELSADEPLPETYHANRIRLFAQSPRKLYLYWEFLRDPYETLRRAFSGRADGYTLVVKLVDLDGGSETLHIASPTRSQWFEVRQGHSYRADVGFYAEGRAFIRLLSSTATRTPRGSVSRRADQSPRFTVSPDEFARVLDDAGYVSDALEVSLEAADLAAGNGATTAIARQLGGEDLPLMTEEELIEMRGLLAALALGANVEEVQVALSKRLAHWLAAASRSRREAVDSTHLLEILRETLGLEMESTALAFLSQEAMRRAARVSISASEVNLPLRPFHLWMPSMSLERLNAKR